ncbi:MAG: hypothetical protein ACRCVN_03270 [Spirochaetia bacterium]
MRRWAFFFIMFYLILPIPIITAKKTNDFSDEVRVSKPVIMVNGRRVADQAMVKGSDVISVTAGYGEELVLNFSYFMGGVRKNSSDIRHGPLGYNGTQNINIGAFSQAAKGTIWIVSFYARRNENERGDTEVIVFTKAD